MRCEVILLDAGSIFPALYSFNCEYVGNRIRVAKFEDSLKLYRRIDVGLNPLWIGLLSQGYLQRHHGNNHQCHCGNQHHTESHLLLNYELSTLPI